MRSIVLAALLVPLMAFAAGKLEPTTAIAPETGTLDALPARPVGGGAGVETAIVVGEVDTIGGTTYDWQTNGPYYRMLANAPGEGVHAAWMFSASDDLPAAPDRNLRYNYYSYTSGSWTWIDPDYMASGVNVYTDRCGYGNLDIDPTTGVAIVSAHLGDPLRVDVARDMAPGAGIFEYCTGVPNTEGYLWGYISTDSSAAIHCACIDDATSNEIYYAKCDPWCTWTTPVGMASPQPNPDFPSQNVGASKVSQKVCVTWEYAAASPPDPGYYRVSEDGGVSWGPPTELPYPPNAYGGDTLTTYHITSFFPFYDGDDELHIAALIGPVVDGTGLIIPAQVWHWSPDNTPNWSHVTTATCDTLNLLAGVGYNALYAARPCLGEDSRGNLFVVWEQFDSSNVEPTPNVLRADIFVAGSDDNGMTWGDPVKLTDGGEGSRRFPSIIDMAVSGGSDPDTVWISYMVDSIAAFAVQEEGPATFNPIIVQKVPVDSIMAIGIQEPGSAVPARIELSATPNPFGGRTVIRYALPREGMAAVTVYDATGRPVRKLAQGRHAAGSYRVAWDGRADGGERVAAGVYFYELATDDIPVTGKLVVTR